ncbi:MAG: hypothetical protein HY847_10465, partial [Betaproteobacteria bacterium]|nr:hypothetical protein [Betaproteobacteria bacterium]
ATWALSPIKFQADMGILLAFMFVWNMLGALVLLPALARFFLAPEYAAEYARSGEYGQQFAEKVSAMRSNTTS